LKYLKKKIEPEPAIKESTEVKEKSKKKKAKKASKKKSKKKKE
jgi:hypothetical protein